MQLNSTGVIDALSDLFILKGIPQYIRSDNGAEFIAKELRNWIGLVGVQCVFIETGLPGENGDVKRFNVRLRDDE